MNMILLSLVSAAAASASPGDPAPMAPVAAPMATARAQDEAPPVTLVDERLRRTRARIVSVSPSQLIAEINGAAERATPAERWVGWTSPLEEATAIPMLSLADGQRFYGAPAGGAGDIIRWTADGAGPIEVDLEDIDRIVLAPRLDPGPSEALEDVVILSNGDRLEGFVISLGDEVVIEVEGRPVELPLQRVAVIDLASAPADRAGAYMWFADGSVARLEAQGDTFLLAQAPSGWEAAAPLHKARAFVYDGARIRALGELPLTSHEPIKRRWAPPPQIEAGAAGMWASPVNLPGPMRVTWSLPEGAARFGAVLELREDSRVWGDCEVVVAQRRAGDVGAGTGLVRVRLTGAEPRAEVTVDLNGGLGAGELVITVEPGASGPIQDRVRIDGALLLLGE